MAVVQHEGAVSSRRVDGVEVDATISAQETTTTVSRRASLSRTKVCGSYELGMVEEDKPIRARTAILDDRCTSLR